MDPVIKLPLGPENVIAPPTPLRFSVQHAYGAAQFLIDYTGVSAFGSGSLQMAALPETAPQSVCGGGWGALAFRESAALYSEVVTWENYIFHNNVVFP